MGIPSILPRSLSDKYFCVILNSSYHISTIAIIQRMKNMGKYIRNPPRYLTASLVVAFCGSLNGLDTGVIGPVTTMPSFQSTFGALPSSVHGIVVSCLLLAAGFASLFSGALSDRFGRPRAIAVGCLAFSIGAAIEAGASSLGMFIAGRCIVGVGEGLFLSTLVVYICETTPPRHRGILAGTVQVLICSGIMIGYFMCYGTIKLKSSLSWRFPIAFQAGYALLLAATAYFYLPQSPRWLAFKGRGPEATAVWDKLGVSSTEREKDLERRPMLSSETVEDTGSAKIGFVERIRQSMTNFMAIFGKSSRKQMLLGVFMMSMQQLSGIDGVLYYAPLLFSQAGISSTEAAFLASGISAILICVSTIIAFMLVDKWGRRASTIYGGLLIFTCMILMGMLYATDSVHADYGIGRWVVIITIYVFAVTYAMTWALGVKLFASEIQPIATRATATSLAQAANCMSNFFVAFITPVLLASSSSGIYFLFGTCVFATVAVCAIFMPETRGQALETIGESFQNHRSNVGSWTPVRFLRKLASRIGRRETWSSASSGRASMEANDVRSEPADELEEPVMTGAVVGEHEDVVTHTSLESPEREMSISGGIELAVLEVPAST